MRLVGEVTAEVRTRHVHHLVSVLHRRRHPHGSGPIEVHVRKMVAQLLHEVRAEMVSGLKEIHEVSRSDGTLVDVLRDEEEVLIVPPEKNEKRLKFTSIRHHQSSNNTCST